MGILFEINSFAISPLTSSSLSLFDSIFGLIFVILLKIELNPLWPFNDISCSIKIVHFLPTSLALQKTGLQKAELSFKKQGNVGNVVPSEVAYGMKQQGDDIVLVDVREKEEWDAEHIPGAIWIPHSKLKDNDNESWRLMETLAKTHKNVFTYCGAGHRSGFIASKAQEKGFVNVFNLDGFSFWKTKFPIIKGESHPDKEAKPVHLDEAYYYYTSFNDVEFIDVREQESIL